MEINLSDIQNWTQEQKNMTKAMVSLLLYENGITHDGIKVMFPNINVLNPSMSISDVITEKTIIKAFNTWKIESDAKIAEAVIESEKRKLELRSNELVDIKLDNVVTRIDALLNISEVKDFLKILVKYIVAKDK